MCGFVLKKNKIYFYKLHEKYSSRNDIHNKNEKRDKHVSLA